MTLFIFKYALPTLLGYTLFVGLAGRYNPFGKPSELEERPPWFLGLWTGMSVFMVLSIGLHIAYGLTLEEGRTIAAPSAVILSALLLIGFISYFIYKSNVYAELDAIQLSNAKRVDRFINWNTKVDQLDSILAPTGSSNSPHTALSATVERLKEELTDERKLRVETEQHVRIMRKALASNEGITAQHNNASTQRAMPMTSASAQYAQDAQAMASNEPMSYENMEMTIANLRRDLVKARHDIRNHVAARAKALSTANKSVAFARQSIELRGKLESELKLTQATLANRQSTIANLVSKLEKGRGLSDAELAALSQKHATNDAKLPNAGSDGRMASAGNAKFTSGF